MLKGQRFTGLMATAEAPWGPPMRRALRTGISRAPCWVFHESTSLSDAGRAMSYAGVAS
jgi:hypothetical protein